MNNKIYILRHKQGLSIKDLANMLNISTTSLLNIEQAKQLPNVRTALKLARLLKVQVHELFIL